MLAIARALMSRPQLLLLDEPSLGLAPKIVADVTRLIRSICDEDGVSILLVEQNASVALALADYGYVLENGRVVLDGTAEALRAEVLRPAVAAGKFRRVHYVARDRPEG